MLPRDRRRGPYDVDAGPWTVPCRVHHLKEQLFWHVSQAAPRLEQCAVRVFDIGEAVGVEFKDFRGVLDAKPIAGA